MEHLNIHTGMGTIATYQRIVPGTIPVVFLHGVYYDHHLWNYFTSRITDRTVMAIDMPHHGNSKAIQTKKWTMTDCAAMLIDVLEALAHDKVFAVGHSWGSMTLLRAATSHPSKFMALGLCNMPFERGSFNTRIQFWLQHRMLPFRSFYAQQVGKVLFSKAHRAGKPELAEYLELSLSRLTNREIRMTDRAVITHVDNGMPFLQKLSVPALALKGKEDYVGIPAGLKIEVVEGAHTSPLEAPEAVLQFIHRVFEMPAC